MAEARTRSWQAEDRAAAGGLRLVPTFDGAIAEDDALGRRCFAARNPTGAAQAYFVLERPHPFTGRPLDFEVEVLADRPCSLTVQYDSTDRAVRVVPHLPGAFKSAAPAALPANGWRRVTFAIPDPRFCRSVNGADLRIVTDLPPPLPLRLRSARIEAREPLRRDEAGAGVADISFPEVAAPRASIVIPVYGRIDLTLACLAALRASLDVEAEIIVVSDGSTDSTVVEISRVAGVRLVASETNRGFANACNAGAALARAPLLLFLNNDTLPQRGWLAAMVAAVDRDPTIGIVGSRLLFPETGEVQHAGVVFSPDGYPSHRHELARADDAEVTQSAIVPAVTGACLLMRSELFRRCGGFDERYRNGFEDLDLCLRARELGFHVFYCASSVVFHHVSASEGRGAHDVRNLELFRARWRDRLAALPL